MFGYETFSRVDIGVTCMSKQVLRTQRMLDLGSRGIDVDVKVPGALVLELR